MKWSDKTKGGYEVHIFEEFEGNVYGRVKFPNEGWCSARWGIDGEVLDLNGEEFDLVPKWEPKDGEPVWVRDLCEKWYARVFSHMSDYEWIVTYNFKDGVDLWNDVAPWNNGKPPS